MSLCLHCRIIEDQCKGIVPLILHFKLSNLVHPRFAFGVTDGTISPRIYPRVIKLATLSKADLTFF